MSSDVGGMTEKEGQAYLAHIEVAGIVRHALPRIIAAGVVAGVVPTVVGGWWGSALSFLILAAWTIGPSWRMFDALDRKVDLPEGHPLNPEIPIRFLMLIPLTAGGTCLAASIVTMVIVGV